METDAQEKLSMESLELPPANDPLFDEADAMRRSEKTILQWMEYLPDDCIHSMIEMEWDITT